MTGNAKFWVVLTALLIYSHSVFGSEDAGLNGLDAFWAEAANTVIEGDFEGYKETYHEDAILVSEPSQTSYLIGEALKGWEQGFIDTRSGKMEANLEFRFTQRFHDADTAHETGIFYYSAKAEGEERNDSYVHFEALLIRQDDWKVMMEYQKSPATQDEWAAAR